MHLVPWLLLLTLSSAALAEAPPPGPLTLTLPASLRYDSNPLGTSGTSAALLGDRSTFVSTVGVSVATRPRAATAPPPAWALAYAAEFVRFDQLPGETHSTHRLSGSGRLACGPWTFSGEGSTLLVAGLRDMLLATPTVNANGVALWRERRRQWQHRLKLQSQARFGSALVRLGARFLACDYQTQVVAGHVAFADRADATLTLDLGWQQSARSLWLAGLRLGRQEQAIVPLPNCEFDYSSDSTRLALGWEGQLFPGTSATLAAGPDFRHYTGAIDPRVWVGGRDRTSLWFESTLTSRLTATTALTAKASRADWLSSTGKSAYRDTCLEAQASWTPAPTLKLLLTARLHRCEFFPVARDDWESLYGIGAVVTLSPRATLSLDLTRHQAGNALRALPERAFHRTTAQLGVSLRL